MAFPAELKGWCAVLCSGCLTLSNVLRITPPSRQSRPRHHQPVFGFASQPLTDPSDGAGTIPAASIVVCALIWCTAE